MRGENQSELEKMNLSPKETEVRENEMSEDKDNGSGDEVVILQNNGRKHAMAPGRKKGGQKSLAPMFAEKLISPSRKGAMWAKQAQDRRSAKLENHENFEENEDDNSELDELKEGKESSSRWFLASACKVIRVCHPACHSTVLGDRFSEITFF
ncbi:putative uncharacterized protein encoded by LINC00471 [Otolemur garnettii]|uniref:putative uncharacterized protein encoded by LINC00471 n=1 Tax=Otolemur garnettii TaxID=30611 RepID=UPI000C7EC402|nr:putative uncharacterized protein encoded by LINC00471 [Otolemur garnettii]